MLAPIMALNVAAADDRPSVTVDGVTVYDGDLISSNATNEDGTPTYESLDIYIAKVVSDTETYKRLILNPQVFDSYGHLNWGDVMEVSPTVMDSFTTSDLARQDGTDEVYSLVADDDAGTKHWVDLTATQFIDEAGADADSIYTINGTDNGSYTTGAAYTVVQDFIDRTPPAAAAEGDLTVALASDTPAATTVPYSSTNVGYLKVNLTAGSGDVTIDSMTFKRSGAGTASDFDAVYLYDGSVRLTYGRSVSSTTNEVVFNNLGITVAAGSVKTIDLIADLDTTTGSNGNIDAFSLTAVVTDADVDGLPVAGNIISIGSVGAGTVIVAKSGTLTNPTVGEADVEVAKFKITAGTEDISIPRVSLYQAGSISNSDLTNLKLYQGTTLLAETEAMNGEYAIFDLDPVYGISNGQNKTLTVKADVGGRTSETIRFYLEEKSDLKVTGDTYGYGQKITNNYDGSAAAKYSETTLQGGSITMAFNGPVATNVSTGSDDAVFTNIAMTSSGQDAQIRKVRLYLCDSAGDMDATKAGYFSDVKVSDDTATLSGPGTGAVTVTNVCNGSTHKGWLYTFSDKWIIEDGETKNLRTTADINSSASGSYYFELVAFGSTDIKDADSSSYITDVVPAGAITGNNMTVAASSLTVTLASTPVSTTIVKKSTDVDSVAFLFAAGSQSKATVSSIILTGQGDIDGDGYLAASLDDVVASCSLYEGDTLIAGPKAPSSTGKITFTNFLWEVAAGASSKLTVKCDTSSSIGTSAADHYWIGIDQTGSTATTTTDITAEDKDSNTINPTDGSGNWTDSVNSSSGVLMTVEDSGSITSAIDSSTPTSTIIVAGTNDVEFSKVKLSATYEAMKVTKMRITNAGYGTYTDDEIASVTISYPKESGTGTATGYLSAGNANFTLAAGEEMYVPKDESAVITIKANLNAIASGADSGEQPQFGLSDGGFEAVGADSGVTKTSITARNGSSMIVRKTVPSVSLETLPSTTLADGTMTISKFTVAADSGADVAIKKFSFDITVSDSSGAGLSVGNNTTTGFQLYDASTPSTPIAGTLGDGAADTTPTFTDGSGTLLFKPTSEIVVSAGSSKTFIIKAVTSGSAQYDSVLVRLASEGTAADVETGAITANTNTLLYAGSDDDDAFIWSDNSDTSHDATEGSSSSDWTNGYLVDIMPSDYQSISRQIDRTSSFSIAYNRQIGIILKIIANQKTPPRNRGCF